MRNLYLVSCVVLLEGLSFAVVWPVLSPFAEQLGGDEAWAGLLFALSTAPRIVFAPIWGRLSDRWGRRAMLACVTAGTMLASLLWAGCVMLDGVLFSALVWLLISRSLTGLFSAQSVLAMAVASDVSEPARRAGAMGVLGAAFGLAISIGPGLGGWFAHVLAIQHIGYLAAAFQALELLVILVLLHETHPNHTADKQTIFVRPTALLRLATLRPIALLLGLCVLATSAYSVMLPTFQPISEQWYGFSIARAGMALSLFGVIGAVVQGGAIRPMVKRYGETATAAVGLGLLGAGLAWIAAHPAEWGFWGGTILMAIGTGLAVPSITALLSLAVPAYDQGAIHGLNQSATSFGRAGGYLLGGMVYAELSPAAAYISGAAAALLSAMVLLVRSRTNATAREVSN